MNDFYLVFERVRDEDIVYLAAGDYRDVKHLAKDDGVIEVARLALVHPVVFLPRVVDLQCHVSPPQHVVLEPPMGVLIDLLEKSLHLLARPTLQLHYIISHTAWILPQFHFTSSPY